jgi:hypothetical protein
VQQILNNQIGHHGVQGDLTIGIPIRIGRRALAEVHFDLEETRGTEAQVGMTLTTGDTPGAMGGNFQIPMALMTGIDPIIVVGQGMARVLQADPQIDPLITTTPVTLHKPDQKRVTVLRTSQRPMDGSIK